MRASPESRRVVPRPGGARSAGGARRRARRRIRECAPCPRGPRAARTAGTPFGPSGGRPLPRTRTTNVIFDRSGEGLTHGPIPADVRMETIRGSPQAVRIPGIRDGGVGIAKQDPEDLREVLDPRIEAENVPGRASRSHVVWEQGSCDGHDAGIENVGIHRREVTLDRLRSLPPEDVVHSRQDDRVRRTDLEDVSPEPIANFLRGLAVDPPVQDGPLGVSSHHPERVLALRIPVPSRGRFERRPKTRGTRGGGIAKANNREGPLLHRAAIDSRVNMLTEPAPLLALNVALCFLPVATFVLILLGVSRMMWFIPGVGSKLVWRIGDHYVSAVMIAALILIGYFALFGVLLTIAFLEFAGGGIN